MRSSTRRAGHPVETSGWTAAFVFQFLLSIYGGYFGAGIGILMLAEFGLLGFTDIHHMIALRSYLAFCINVVAAIILRGARLGELAAGDPDGECAGLRGL